MQTHYFSLHATQLDQNSSSLSIVCDPAKNQNAHSFELRAKSHSSEVVPFLSKPLFSTLRTNTHNRGERHGFKFHFH